MTEFDEQTGERLEPHRGTLVLILGILSLTVCAITGPFAWTMGKADMAKIRAGTMDSQGEGITKAGMICGIIGTVFLGLLVLYIIAMVLFLVVAAGSA